MSWGVVVPGWLIVNGSALELSPFNRTVIETWPGAWIRLFVTGTTMLLTVMLVGISAVDPKITWAPETNPDPLIVRLKFPEFAARLAGLRLVICGAAGVGAVTSNVRIFEFMLFDRTWTASEP